MFGILEAVDNFSGSNRFQLGSNESWALTWLNMLELNYIPKLTFDIESHAIF